MKLVLPEVDTVFDCDADSVNCLVIENQGMLSRIMRDLYDQINGQEGRSVLSENDRVLPIGKNMELLSQFVPFQISQRHLVNKAISVLHQIAMDEVHYMRTAELMSEIERYLLELSMDTVGDIEFTGATAEILLKACGLSFSEDYDSLAEKLIDYFELVTEYERKKLFVLMNVRSFLSDMEMEQFIQTALQHGYQLFLVESFSRSTLKSENRYLIDENLCEIC